MIDMDVMVDRVAMWAAFLWEKVPAAWPLSPGMTALVGVFVGLVLALWGARLLHMVFTVVFMVLGAAVGYALSSRFEVEILIGLVAGAGLGALVAHLFYRQWVGTTAALVAMVVAGVLGGGPAMLADLESFRVEFDSLGAVMPNVAPEASDQAAMAREQMPAGGGDEATSALTRWLESMWQEHRSGVMRLLLLVSLASMAGFAVGITFPRFTTVVGTGGGGAVLMAVSGAYLLRGMAPGIWEFLRANPNGYLAGTGVVALLAMLYQLRHRSAPAAVAPAAVPVAGASGGGSR